MANESSTHHMRTTSLSQLASVDRGDKIDFPELLWKNGQILLRGDSNINAVSKQDQELGHCQWLNCPQFNQNIGCRVANSKQFNDLSTTSKQFADPSPGVQHLQPASTPPPKQKQPRIVNFSHFLRPDIFVNTNPQRQHDASLMSCSNPNQSTLINSSSKLSTSLKKVDVKHSHDHADCLVAAFANSRIIDQDLAQTSSRTIGGSRNNMCVELALPCSSLCSRNDPKHQRKRKSTRESDYLSEDVEEEESKGVRKPAAARCSMSIKRSRTAQVHNLSERRRRDKINKKMRALQQLIPGGSKVDKASMLDDAIEYLQTLQIQVQMMSMGMGLFMPPNPMMLPTGIQHMNVPHLPPFSPVIACIGMGFGMGMFEITGHSSGWPLKHQVSLPYQPISGMPMPMPPAPFVPLSR